MLDGLHFFPEPWILPIELGGTNASEKIQALLNLLPTIAGQANKVLAVNGAGTAVEWTTATPGTGEVNTALNYGVGGVGVFNDKAGLDLRFRNLNAGSTKLSVTLDAGNREIDLDVAEANLTLSNLGGSLQETKGGTGQTTYALGDTFVATGADALSVLPGNSGAKGFLTMTSSVASWAGILEADLPGHEHSGFDITTDYVQPSVGGTGITTYTAGDILAASAPFTLAKVSGNVATSREFLISSGNGVSALLPTFGPMLGSDIPVFVASGAGHAPGTVPDPGAVAGTSKFLREDSTWATPAGAGTVTSVGLNAASVPEISVAVTSTNPITNADTFVLTKASQTANTVWAAPSGAAGVPTFRALTATDIPTIPSSKISDFSEAVDDRVGSLMQSVASTLVTYDDALNTLTASVVDNTTNQKIRVYDTGGLIGTRRAINLIEGSNITLTLADNGVDDRVDITIAASGGGSTHDLLSATHTDTTAAAVLRGSIIAGVGASPKWGRLALGAANRVLISDGTDLAYGQVPLATAVSGTLPVANGGTGVTSGTVGDIFYFSGATTLSKLPIGSAGQFLKVAAGIPSWAAGSALNYYAEVATTPSTAPSVSGTDTVAIGWGAVSAGTRSIAAGYSRSFGQDTFAAAIGNNTSTYGASGNYAVALGLQAKATGHRGFAAGGTASVASGNDAVALGSVTASGTNAFAGGGTSNAASGTSSATLGGSSNAAAATNSAVIGGTFASVTAAGTGGVAVAGGTVSGAGGVAIGASTTSGSSAAADNSIALGAQNLSNVWKHSVTMGTNGFSSMGGVAFASALTAWSATSPALICGAGSANTTGSRANAFVLTFDSRFILGGQADGAEGAGNTGKIELGTPSSLFFAKIQAAAQAANRTYTIIDAGGPADFVVSTSTAGQSILGGLTANKMMLSGIAPPVATDAGTINEIRVDANYIYVSTTTAAGGAGAWKRVAIATW